MESIDEQTAIGAEDLINQTVDQAAPGNIISELERAEERLKTSEAQRVQMYINGIRPQIQGAIVQDLNPGIGGQYDGNPSVTIAASTLMVDSSIEETIARAEEVRAHENYHAANNHLEPIAVVNDTRTNAFAVIGGYAFTQTELIEGLTVMQTGNTFVSDEYRAHEQALSNAMTASGQTVGDIEEAVNRAKDLSLIDDRSHIGATTLAV